MASPSGNRCGHNPANPRVDLAKPTSSRMLWFVDQAMRAAEAIVFDRKRFPDLGPRKRSERLEALVLVAKALLYRMDIVTLRVGTGFSDGSCSGITARSLGVWTGMNTGRVTRALADLRDAGYINTRQPRELVDGHYFGLASIRNLTLSFFNRLGLSLKLSIERTRTSKRRREAAEQQRKSNPQEPADGTPDAPLRRSLRRLAKNLHRRAEALSPREAAASEERSRRLIELQLTVRQHYPDWSLDQVRAEATRLLR